MPRVLLADDSHLVRWAVGRALQAGGFEVVNASALDETLGHLVSAWFDLLVVPLSLGRREIRDLIAAVSRHQPATAIILLATSEDAGALATDTSIAVLGKPFSVTELVATAHRLTAGAATTDGMSQRSPARGLLDDGPK